MQGGTPMFGNVTALEALHVTGKYRDRSMQHTCSRHAATLLPYTPYAFSQEIITGTKYLFAGASSRTPRTGVPRP